MNILIAIGIAAAGVLLLLLRTSGMKPVPKETYLANREAIVAFAKSLGHGRFSYNGQESRKVPIQLVVRSASKLAEVGFTLEGLKNLSGENKIRTKTDLVLFAIKNGLKTEKVFKKHVSNRRYGGVNPQKIYLRHLCVVFFLLAPQFLLAQQTVRPEVDMSSYYVLTVVMILVAVAIPIVFTIAYKAKKLRSEANMVLDLEARQAVRATQAMLELGKRSAEINSWVTKDYINALSSSADGVTLNGCDGRAVEVKFDDEEMLKELVFFIRMKELDISDFQLKADVYHFANEKGWYPPSPVN